MSRQVTLHGTDADRQSATSAATNLDRAHWVSSRLLVLHQRVKKTMRTNRAQMKVTTMETEPKR